MAGKVFIETFDSSPRGWIGWEGKVGATRVEVRDGAAISRSPWWVDFNHCHPGEGYLHILFALHTSHGQNFPKQMLDVAGPNPYVEGGFPTNLTNAKVTVRIKGEVNLCGAQCLFHAQGNVPQPGRPKNWVNQVLIQQPIRITKDWSEQTLHLVPDQSQWLNLGSRHDRTDMYGKAPIADLLRDVNGDIIFVLFPLDVRPLKPIQGDPYKLRAGHEYEVDRSRLPEGYVMMDEFRIEFP